jgi:hypothetical protein
MGGSGKNAARLILPQLTLYDEGQTRPRRKLLLELAEKGQLSYEPLAPAMLASFANEDYERIYMIDEVILPEVVAFLERYKRFTTEKAGLRVHTFQVEFAQLKVALQAIEKLGRALEMQQAPRFNLFQLLDVARAERRTHAALLAELLNPEGCHGQGYLFLKTYFEHCWQKEGFDDFPRPAGELNSALWFIDTEKVTDCGTMDVVVSSPELQVVLVIENKIDAQEQDQQLQRYAEWMKRIYPEKYRKALVFLTPDGHAARTSAGEYYRLSYREDIRQWLERVMPMIQAPRVRETVAQYLEVVTTL